MSAIVVGIISLIVGAAVGYSFRAMSEQGETQKALTDKLMQSESALVNYKQEVAEHLDRSAKLLSQMNETCQVAMQQMEQSTKLLQQATPTELVDAPFFATETTQQLAETAEMRNALRRQRKKESVVSFEQPPLDYSTGASGLFADQKASKQAVTNSRN